jgi:diguanylate cyclase (GGDEF)-like protein
MESPRAPTRCRQSTIGATGDVIVKHLRRLIPFAQYALFLYDATGDELVVHHAVGDASSSIMGLRISLGQRLSGWVAANRQIILNSDPALDLGDISRSMKPRLRSSLSTPLISDNELVGVLTLYSTVQDAFTENHRRVIAAVARQISHAFKNRAQFEISATRDPVTGVPNLQQLEHMVDAAAGGNVSPSNRITLLLIDVVRLKDINDRYGRDAGDQALRHVVKLARTGLRANDILFRYRNDEFVVLLGTADSGAANAMAAQIRENIRAHELKVAGVQIPVEVRVSPLVADGASFSDRIASARRQMHEVAGGKSIVH